MYDELYEAWLREKEISEIQKLSKDFYSRVADYVKKMREERRMLDEKTTKARLMHCEAEYVSKMIRELIDLRYDKVVNRIREDGIVNADALTEEEEKLYKPAMPIKDAVHSLVEEVTRGVIKEARNEAKYITVRFLKEIPAIIGSDMKTYGPFKPEDLGTLPVENARMLIKESVAIEVEVR